MKDEILDPHDKYVRFYGKNLAQLERERMIERYAENYHSICQILHGYDETAPMKDLQTLDSVIYDQAVQLNDIRSKMEDGLFDDKGEVCLKNLGSYLQVLKQFGTIYNSANITLTRRFLVHK